MLNTLDFYFDIGKKVAVARNERDESRAIFEMDYLRRALGVEKREDKPAARAAYDAGFKEYRNVPRVEYFK
jgi:hypothetical protein